MAQINFKKGFREGVFEKSDRLRFSGLTGTFESCINLCAWCQHHDPGWCVSAQCEVYQILKECMEEIDSYSDDLESEIQDSYMRFLNDCNCEV